MIKIFRQYPIINGFLQLPNNLESEKSKYILAGDGKLNPPTGTSIAASAISDVPSSVVVSEIAGTKWVEFDTGFVAAYNFPPSNFTLSSNEVTDSNKEGGVIGIFSASDPDSIVLNFALVSGSGGDDNDAFSISSSSLLTKANYDYSITPTYTIRGRVSDETDQSVESIFEISSTANAPLNTVLRLGVTFPYDNTMYLTLTYLDGDAVINIDWGDDSSETFESSGTYTHNISHEYADSSDRTITITRTYANIGYSSFDSTDDVPPIGGVIKSYEILSPTNYYTQNGRLLIFGYAGGSLDLSDSSYQSLRIRFSDSLSTVDLRNSHTAGSITISDNSAMTTVYMQNWSTSSTTPTIDFRNNSLSLATMNSIMAALDSTGKENGELLFQGGDNDNIDTDNVSYQNLVAKNWLIEANGIA